MRDQNLWYRFTLSWKKWVFQKLYVDICMLFIYQKISSLDKIPYKSKMSFFLFKKALINPQHFLHFIYIHSHVCCIFLNLHLLHCSLWFIRRSAALGERYYNTHCKIVCKTFFTNLLDKLYKSKYFLQSFCQNESLIFPSDPSTIYFFDMCI